MERVADLIWKFMVAGHEDRAEELGILIGQLITWIKLSEDKELEKEQEYNFLLPLLDSSKATVDEKFIQLRKKYGQAFKLGDLLENIESSWLDNLLDVLWSAKQRGMLEYTDAMTAIWNLIEQSRRYPKVPDELVDLMVQFALSSTEGNFYVPFTSSTKIALELVRQNREVFVESEVDSRLFDLATIIGPGHVTPYGSDPIRSPMFYDGDSLIQFDTAVSIPPFGTRYGKGEINDLYNRFPEETFYGEILHIRHLMAQVDGRVYVLVPDSLLFRTSAGEKEFKRSIIEDGLLRAIIDIPATLGSSSYIKPVLMVLDHESPNLSRNEILFADLAEHFPWGSSDPLSLDSIRSLDSARMVSAEEIEANSFNLLVGRYIYSESARAAEEAASKIETATLEEFSTQIRPQSLRAKGESVGTVFKEVMVSDIPSFGYLETVERETVVTSALMERARKQELQPLDILLSIKGSIGKVGLVPERLDGRWIAGQSLLVIRLNIDSSHEIDPRALYLWLRSEIAQGYFQHRAGGAVIQMLKTTDIKSLPVPIMSEEDQNRVIKTFQQGMSLRRNLEQIESELTAIPKRHWNIKNPMAVN